MVLFFEACIFNVAMKDLRVASFILTCSLLCGLVCRCESQGTAEMSLAYALSRIFIRSACSVWYQVAEQIANEHNFVNDAKFKRHLKADHVSQRNGESYKMYRKLIRFELQGRAAVWQCQLQ